MMDFSINKFTGKWRSESGYSIEIQRITELQASVSLLDCNGKPVLRPYFNNCPTIGMIATYDDYDGTFEVDLWEKGKGFTLHLDHEYSYELDHLNRESLIFSISRYEEDNFLDTYYKLFGPLDHFTREKA